MKTQSDELNELAPALVAAQTEMKDVVATETAEVTMQKGGKYAYKYCDLATVRETVLPVLTRHGICVTQTITPRREAAFAERFCVLGSVRTMLLHSSGQWIAGEQPIAGDWSDAQRIGSAITYARRYGLAAICGVAQVDDDGGSAAPPARSQSNGHATQRSNRPLTSDGPPIEEYEPPDTGPEPYSAAWYRLHPEEAARAEAARDFSRRENAARFNPDPPERDRHPRPIDPQIGVRISLPSDPPRTGKFLFGWVKENDQWDYFNYLVKRYPTQLPEKISAWGNTQVKWAWDQYVNWLESGGPLPAVPNAVTNGKHS